MRRTIASCWASLRPKIRAIGLDPGEQLGNNRSHTLEVSRPVRTLEFIAQLVDIDSSQLLCGIHLGELRGEHDIGPRRSGQGYVALEVPGIAIKVLIPVELEWIDKQRHHNRVALCTSGFNQRQMSFV